MSRQPTGGKRRAESSSWRRRRRREAKPAGRRADRPENNEGITPEFLNRLREVEAEATAPPVPPSGPGGRKVLAGIAADLRADQEYLQALSRLAYG
jgi:hypothetical protein